MHDGAGVAGTELDSGPNTEVSQAPDVFASDVEHGVPRGTTDQGLRRGLPFSLRDFRYRAVLGRGGFGKVLLAECKYTRKAFAVKTIKKADIVTRNKVKRLMEENQILRAASGARHPFIVNLFASFQTFDRVFFVMEYAAGGDLVTNLKKVQGVFPEPRARFYAACIVLGLEFLHQQKIIHRDLKLENIVLDSEGFAKITDFGLSKQGMGFGDRTRSICGTLSYMAPEMLTEKPYTRAIDWWSFGVLLYRMLVGTSPFAGKNDWEVENNIIHNNVSCPRTISAEVTSLITGLLNRDPAERLGGSEKDAEDVKGHPFFEKVKWTKLLARKVKPPFLPEITGPYDVSNFEEQFRSATPTLTPPRGRSLTEEQQGKFEDFDWMAK